MARSRRAPVDLRRSAERLRIARFRMRTSYSRHRGTLGLAAGSLWPVLMGAALLAVSLLSDVYLLPAIGVGLPQGASNRLPPVLTTVAGFTGLIALAVTVSTGPLQSALARFPADVGAPLVEDEPRDGLLALVIVTFTLAVGSLVVSVFGWATLVTGPLLAVFLAVFTLATLVGYVKQRVVLFDTANLARYLAWQMNRWAEAASRRPRENPGPSITTFLRERHLSNFDRMVSMCRALLEAGQHEEAREVLRTLTSAVSYYAARRRRLDPEGEWFPMREVAVEGYDDVVSPMYEHLALGTARRPERDAHWFERRAGRAWADLLQTAAANEAGAFAQAWTSSVVTLMRTAYRQQEFELLDRLLQAFMSALPALGELRALGPAAGVPLLLSELLDNPGFAIERAEATSKANPSFDADNVWRAGLPTIATDTMLDLGARLRNEARVAGRIVTPPREARRELVDRLSRRKAEAEERYATGALDALSSILKHAARQEDASASAAAIDHGLLMADRQLLRGREETAERAARESCAHLERATGEVAGQEQEATVEQLRRLVLRALTTRSLGIVEAAMPRLIVGLIDSPRSNDAPLHDLLAVGALARLAAELDGEPRLERAVEAGLDAAKVDKEHLARTLLEEASPRMVHRFLPAHVWNRYFPYLSVFSEEIGRLPRGPVEEPWEVYEPKPDHPSELVRAAEMEAASGRALDECVASFLKALLPQKETEEKPDE